MILPGHALSPKAHRLALGLVVLLLDEADRDPPRGIEVRAHAHELQRLLLGAALLPESGRYAACFVNRLDDVNTNLADLAFEVSQFTKALRLHPPEA